MLTIALRYSLLSTALLLYIILELSTDIYVLPRTELTICTEVGISFLIGLAILIWLFTGDKRPEPIEVRED